MYDCHVLGQRWYLGTNFVSPADTSVEFILNEVQSWHPDVVFGVGPMVMQSELI